MNVPLHSEFSITTSSVPVRGSLTFAFAARSSMCLLPDRLCKFHTFYLLMKFKTMWYCRYSLSREYHSYTSINLLRCLSGSLSFGGSCVVLNYSDS